MESAMLIGIIIFDVAVFAYLCLAALHQRKYDHRMGTKGTRWYLMLIVLIIAMLIGHVSMRLQLN